MSEFKNLKFRIRDEEQSKCLQKVFEEANCVWIGGQSFPSFISAPYLLVDEYKQVFFEDDSDRFDACYYKEIVNVDYFINYSDIKENTQMTTANKTNNTNGNVPHKHAELIKKWADGGIIQFRADIGDWRDCTNNNPYWVTSVEYRVKPQRVFPISTLTDSELSDIWAEAPYGVVNSHRAAANAAIKRYIEETEQQ